MVDEAHALGVLGPRGFGTADRFGVDPGEVDIWMGTLSKSLVSCGGYIAGSKELVDYLKLVAPGICVFGRDGAAGCCRGARRARNPAARAGAGTPAQRQGRPLPAARAGRRSRCRWLDRGLDRARRDRQLDPRRAPGAERCFGAGINVQPILYPAVPERAARLRFFLTAAHSDDQIRETVAILMEESRQVASAPSDLAAVAKHLAKSRLPSR